MDDTLLNQCQKTIANLTQHFHCFRLWTLHAWFDICGEVTITQFLYDVVILRAFHHVIEAYDVIRVQFLYDFYLVLEGSLQVFIAID